MSPSPVYGRSRDSNERQIVKVLEACGWLVCKHDLYDLQIQCPGCKAQLSVEIKTAKGRLTPKQKDLIERGWQLHVVKTVRDALDLVQKHRQEAHGETRRANVQFVEVIDKHHIRIEIWERGACYTLSSGTSSCAAAAACCRLGMCQTPVTVSMPGGELCVELDPDYNASIEGPANEIAHGEIPESLLWGGR